MQMINEKFLVEAMESNGSPSSPDDGFPAAGSSRVDVTGLFASLLLSCVQIVPASRRLQVLDQASQTLAALVQAAALRPARVIGANLRAVFGLDNPGVVRRYVRQQLALSIWNALVMGSAGGLSPAQMADLVPVQGEFLLNDSLAAGRPTVVLSYHFGIQPLIAAAVLGAKGYPVFVVSHVSDVSSEGGRERQLYYRQISQIADRFPIIDPREGVQRALLDVLRDNKCLYLTPDYMLPQSEREANTPFEVAIGLLGRTAVLRTGGLRLAKRHQAGAVTVLSAPDEDGRLRLVVEPFVFPTAGFGPADLRDDLQACMRRLELQLLAYPYLWLDLKREDLVERLVADASPLAAARGASQRSEM